MKKIRWQDKYPTVLYCFRVLWPDSKRQGKAEIKNRAGEIIKTFTVPFTSADDDEAYYHLTDKVWNFLESLPDLTWERGKREVKQFNDNYMIDANLKF